MSDSTEWKAWGIPVIVIGALLLIILCLLISRWYIRRPMYRGKARIDGKTVVITGANTGIGKETARGLIKRGARVIILCRNTEKGQKAAEEIREETGETIEVYHLDLADLESVRKCADLLKEKEPKIDILINNAGLILPKRMETKDGFEMQFGTNHLGHFLLTLLLLDNIKAAAPSRIINVSSLGHNFGKMNWDDLNNEKDYGAMKAYSQSKLANILFTKSLAKRLEGSNVSTYVLHPGAVQTEIGRHVAKGFSDITNRIFISIQNLFFKTAEQGAQTTIYCAVDEKIAKETGKYYSGCKKKTPSSRARNTEDAERLWRISLEMVGVSDISN